MAFNFCFYLISMDILLSISTSMSVYLSLFCSFASFMLHTSAFKTLTEHGTKKATFKTTLPCLYLSYLGSTLAHLAKPVKQVLSNNNQN